MEPNIAIHLAQTPAEREAIYRFRYDTYVREMNRTQQYADHDRGWIKEPLDDTAHVLGAFVGDEVVGTYRANFARTSDLGIYDQLYRMNWAGEFHPWHTSISTKLMVAPQYRGSALGIRIAVAGYKLCRMHGIEFDFIDCNDPLLGFFGYLGYRQYQEQIVHPEYGRVNPLVLALSDEAHLQAVKSPFRKVVAECSLTRASVKYISTKAVSIPCAAAS